MTTIELHNQNKTKVNFSYDNDLPHKKSIRPKMGYGDWIKKPEKTVLKVFLSKDEYSFFTRPEDINGLSSYLIGKDIWIDLEDVYLVLPYDRKIEKQIKKNNFIIAFYYDNLILSVIGN